MRGADDSASALASGPHSAAEWHHSRLLLGLQICYGAHQTHLQSCWSVSACSSVRPSVRLSVLLLFVWHLSLQILCVCLLLCVCVRCCVDVCLSADQS